MVESVCGDPERRRCVGFLFVEPPRFSSTFRLFESVLLLLLVVPADETAVNVAVVAMFFALIGGRGGAEEEDELVCRDLLFDKKNLSGFGLNSLNINVED